MRAILAANPQPRPGATGKQQRREAASRILALRMPPSGLRYAGPSGSCERTDRGPGGRTGRRESRPAGVKARRAAARPSPRFFPDERDLDRNAFAVAFVDVQLDRQPGATADGSSPIDETVAVDVQALPFIRQDEPEVLRLVEPQHRPSHSRTLDLDRLTIRTCCRFRRTGPRTRAKSRWAMPRTRGAPSVITIGVHLARANARSSTHRSPPLQRTPQRERRSIQPLGAPERLHSTASPPHARAASFQAQAQQQARRSLALFRSAARRKSIPCSPTTSCRTYASRCYPHRYTIRPRVRSYGDNSIRTRSPSMTRIR